MAMTDAEIEATRFHLGYGNLDFGAYPYTSDGFKQIFRDVIAPNLTIGAETTATTNIVAGAAVAVTPVSMDGIEVQSRLVVDVGDMAETVVVSAVTVSAFIARFTLAHSGGYPVCVSSGQTRLRQLLHQCEKAWDACLSQNIGGTAGIKKVDEIEFFGGFQVLKDRLSQYKNIVLQLSSLVRLEPQWLNQGGGRAQLEAY